MKPEQNMQVATTILNQLGGTQRLVTMIGARDILVGPYTLQFKFMTVNGINCTRITLDTNTDTYDIKWFHVRGTKVKDMGNIYGIYADQLRDYFSITTGLALSL